MLYPRASGFWSHDQSLILWSCHFSLSSGFLPYYISSIFAIILSNQLQQQISAKMTKPPRKPWAKPTMHKPKRLYRNQLSICWNPMQNSVWQSPASRYMWWIWFSSQYSLHLEEKFWQNPHWQCQSRQKENKNVSLQIQRYRASLTVLD